MAKAKIVRSVAADSVRFDSLDDGDWFLDCDGDLCVKVSSSRATFLFGDSAGVIDMDDDDLVTPVNVTITY